MEQEASAKYQLSSKYFLRLLSKYYDRPLDLQKNNEKDVKRILKVFLHKEESKRFHSRHEKINTLFNLLDQWYKSNLSDQEEMKARDFIGFCKRKQVTFSNSELDYLFDSILGNE
jgi:hypothetical protein